MSACLSEKNIFVTMASHVCSGTKATLILRVGPTIQGLNRGVPIGAQYSSRII
jgi:hypothetical protein